MSLRFNLLIAVMAFASILWPAAAENIDFVDTRAADRLLEVEVHALGGGSSITQNYHKIYPQIQNRNVNLGSAWGVGGRAVFGIRNYLGFGTQLDVMLKHYNIDMAVLGADRNSMSALFLNNHTFSVNIPVFVSFRFNVAHSVRWNIDAGFYYSYGFAGRQRQKIYRAEINAVDELVPEIETVTTDYYHSPRTLFNVFNRGDIGAHIATSLNFGPHLSVGFQAQFGVKNSARHTEISKPSVHNMAFLGLVGFRF